MLSDLSGADIANRETAFAGGRSAAKETRDTGLTAAKEATTMTSKAVDAQIHALDRKSQEDINAANRASNERVAAMTTSVQRESNAISNAQRREQFIQNSRVLALDKGLRPLYKQLEIYTQGKITGLNSDKEVKVTQDLIDLKTDEINKTYDNLMKQSLTDTGKTGSSDDSKFIIRKETRSPR